MYSSLYFVIPVSLVLMCEVCVPRRALPQIAAESKASAPPPAGFQAFCVPIGAWTGPRRCERRIAFTAQPHCCEQNEQKRGCSYCSHALIFSEAYRTKVGQSIILTTTQETERLD